MDARSLARWWRVILRPPPRRIHVRNASPAYRVAVLNYDGDGKSAEEGNCNDNDNDHAIYPGAPELCDRQDNDCDPVTPETCTLGCPHR